MFNYTKSTHTVLNNINQTNKLFNEIGIDHKFSSQLAENILMDSTGIINNHIYS